ncbi:vegetative cell wall protein gp1-like, partial [Brassica napus]|uniref:vegetative cell wall protein gp1-like n=1 Tax=Brassica napus TaxID=3708 RepID=UPI0020786EF8
TLPGGPSPRAPSSRPGTLSSPGHPLLARAPSPRVPSPRVPQVPSPRVPSPRPLPGPSVLRAPLSSRPAGASLPLAPLASPAALHPLRLFWLEADGSLGLFRLSQSLSQSPWTVCPAGASPCGRLFSLGHPLLARAPSPRPGTLSSGALSPGAPGALSPGALSPGALSPGALSPPSPRAVRPAGASLLSSCGRLSPAAQLAPLAAGWPLPRRRILSASSGWRPTAASASFASLSLSLSLPGPSVLRAPLPAGAPLPARRS